MIQNTGFQIESTINSLAKFHKPFLKSHCLEGFSSSGLKRPLKHPTISTQPFINRWEDFVLQSVWYFQKQSILHQLGTGFSKPALLPSWFSSALHFILKRPRNGKITYSNRNHKHDHISYDQQASKQEFSPLMSQTICTVCFWRLYRHYTSSQNLFLLEQNLEISIVTRIYCIQTIKIQQSKQSHLNLLTESTDFSLKART